MGPGHDVRAERPTDEEREEPAPRKLHDDYKKDLSPCTSPHPNQGKLNEDKHQEVPAQPDPSDYSGCLAGRHPFRHRRVGRARPTITRKHRILRGLRTGKRCRFWRRSRTPLAQPGEGERAGLRPRDLDPPAPGQHLRRHAEHPQLPRHRGRLRQRSQTTDRRSGSQRRRPDLQRRRRRTARPRCEQHRRLRGPATWSLGPPYGLRRRAPLRYQGGRRP